MNVQLLRAGATVPTYGTEFSAGADLYACLESPVIIQPGQTGAIPTGIAIEVPVGYAGLVYARSGMATKRDLAPANKVGVIDSDYRGELLVMLHNHGSSPQTICHGERMAQLVITPVLTPMFTVVDTLSQTQRGSGGFGSTGA